MELKKESLQGKPFPSNNEKAIPTQSLAMMKNHQKNFMTIDDVSFWVTNYKHNEMLNKEWTEYTKSVRDKAKEKKSFQCLKHYLITIQNISTNGKFTQKENT